MQSPFDPEIHRARSALPHQKAFSPTSDDERRALYRIIKQFEEEKGRGPEHVEVAKLFCDETMGPKLPYYYYSSRLFEMFREDIIYFSRDGGQVATKKLSDNYTLMSERFKSEFMKGLKVLDDQTATSDTRKQLNLKKLMTVLAGKDMDQYQ